MWFVEQLLLFTWWQYLALAVILLLIAVAFVFYKGYRRIKPTPLKGLLDYGNKLANSQHLIVRNSVSPNDKYSWARRANAA